VYTDITPHVADHDEDADADLVEIDGKEFYKGMLDPRYTDLHVQWLYNDDLRRVGVVESDGNNTATCWIHEDNPYATLLQEPGWVAKNETLWSHMSNEAYQDCLETDFKDVLERSLYGTTCIVLPKMLIDFPSYLYECTECGKRTLSSSSSCATMKKLPFVRGNRVLFVDESFIVYEPPADSRVWSTMKGLQPGASLQVQEEEQAQAQAHRPNQESQCPTPSLSGEAQAQEQE
jgi:hypothetical protein